MGVTGWWTGFRGCVIWSESGVVLEDLRSAVIVPLYYKGKGERIECSNFSGISLLSVVGKIYAGIIADRVRKVTD